MIEPPVRFLSLLCLGLASGITICVLLVERVGTDNAQFYTQLMQMLNRALTIPGPLLGGTGLVATLVDAVLALAREAK